MTTVFYTRLYCRFIEIQSNLRKKKLHRIKVPIFLEAGLTIEIILESQFNLEEKNNASILKDDFSSTKDPPIFTSINTSVIRPIKKIQLSFCRNQQAISCSSPQYILDQIQVQKPTVVAAIDEMPDHSLIRE